MSDIRIPERFTVKRSEWLRGLGVDEDGGANGACLLDYSGKRCCVGFLAKECGIDDEYARNEPILSTATSGCSMNEEKPLKELCTTMNADGIYKTNDDDSISDPAREALLTSKFAALGIAVEFVD